jgi:hypothetical protein
MKKIFLALFCLFCFSCISDEKKIEPPFETIPEEEVVFLKESVQLEKKLIFTVQIASCKKEIKKFEIIEDVRVYREGMFIKYRIGSFDTYQEARALRSQLIKKHKGVFVQALFQNEPISITEALAY